LLTSPEQTDLSEPVETLLVLCTDEMMFITGAPLNNLEVSYGTISTQRSREDQSDDDV